MQLLQQNTRLSLLLDKHTLNPRQHTQWLFGFFDLVWTFPLATVENVRQNIPGQVTSDKCAPGRIAAS